MYCKCIVSKRNNTKSTKNNLQRHALAPGSGATRSAVLIQLEGGGRPGASKLFFLFFFKLF